MLESAATFAALKAEDTQIQLKVDCPKDIGSAEIDERRIKQVLFNLLSNAFAYTSAGGMVTIGAERAAGALKVWISDTGRGISPADQAKAFDSFESRGPSAGVGLGLSLVERFIKLHHGWVRMESKEGEGVRVTCFLPENTSEKTKPVKTAAKPKPRKARAKTPAGGDDNGGAPKPKRRRKKAAPKTGKETEGVRRPHAAE